MRFVKMSKVLKLLLSLIKKYLCWLKYVNSLNLKYTPVLATDKGLRFYSSRKTDIQQTIKITVLKANASFANK